MVWGHSLKHALPLAGCLSFLGHAAASFYLLWSNRDGLQGNYSLYLCASMHKVLLAKTVYGHISIALMQRSVRVAVNRTVCCASLVVEAASWLHC